MWLVIAGLCFHLENEEGAVMLYENRELDPYNYFKNKRLSFSLIKVLRIIQNRLIAMHECYFLMLELGALL